MTHSTVFPVHKELNQAFGDARRDGNVRAIEIFIEDETIVMGRTLPDAGGGLESDYGKVLAWLEPKKPAYVIVRLESRNDLGHEWLLLSYVPDGSPVKARMLYASTRDTLKKALGRSYFHSELYGSTPEDVSFHAYEEHMSKPASAHVALTSSERAAASEASLEVAQGPSGEYVHGVKFPLTPGARQAVEDFAAKAVNWLQLGVAVATETVELITTSQAVFARELGGEIPKDVPRFSLFRFDHEHAGAAVSSVVFIYSCPTGAKIKEKMMYSTVKAVVIDVCEKAGVSVATKVEIDDGDELTEEFLFDRLHDEPRPVVSTPKFKKPPPAAGRSAPSARGRPQRTK